MGSRVPIPSHATAHLGTIPLPGGFVSTAHSASTDTTVYLCQCDHLTVARDFALCVCTHAHTHMGTCMHA